MADQRCDTALKLLTVFFSHRCHINRAFVILFTAGTGQEARKFIKAPLIEGSDGAGPASNGFAGEIEIFTDMTGIQKDVFGGFQAVPPLRPVGDGTPDKYNRCSGSKMLSAECPGQVIHKLMI